jgi:hypothetical protein
VDRVPSWRKPLDLTSERRDLVGCDAGLAELGDETAGLRRIGEGDALSNACGEHGRVILVERLGCLSGDDRACRTAIEHEAGDELRAEDARLVDQLQYFAGGPPIEGRRLRRN